MFARTAASAGERLCVQDRTRRWTYGELRHRADRLARRLLARGAGRGQRVAIYAERNVLTVWAMVGVLEAEAAFTILDAEHPPGRLLEQLRVAQPTLVIDAAPSRDRRLVDSFGAPWIALDDGELALGAVDAAAPDVDLAPDAAAYVLFSSGTTGAPRATEVTHATLAHFIEWEVTTFELTAADRFSALSGLGFSPFSRDVLTPLTIGASIHVPPAEIRLEPDRLAAWLSEQRVTVCHLTPSLGEILARSRGPALDVRWVFVSGEPLRGELVNALRQRIPHATFVNVYGASETSQAVGYHVVGDAAPPGLVPIGSPIDRTQLLVLRSDDSLADVGEDGELCVRSPYLAASYIDGQGGGFGVNPFTGAPGDRIYRTGDRARYLPDGSVTVAGRLDDQVKIRGFRIELAEIEAVLRRHPAVAEVSVAARPAPDGQLQLVAYVVVTGGGSDVAAIRAHLRDCLPDAMIPAAVVNLDRLPLGPTGKVDRRALPEPTRSAYEHDHYAPPRSPEEELLAAMWSEVLAIERVGIRDDFFALGGHSLLATQVLSRVRELFAVELPVSALFDSPTIEQLAVELVRVRDGGRRRPAPPLTPSTELDRSIPSHAQQRMWLLDQLDPAGLAYQLSHPYRLRGALDPEALRRAFEEIVHRHESLRTVFPARGGVPRQQVCPPAPWPLAIDDIVDLDDQAREREIERIAREQAAPFDLERGPLLRTRLIRVADDDHILLIRMHHIVSDGWSRQILLGELDAAYTALCRNRPISLPPLPVQYADYAAWQRRWLADDLLEAQLAYWRDQLADAPADTALPFRRPPPEARPSRGARVTVDLDVDLADRLRGLARATGTTLFMVLLAGLRALLSRYTGQDDLCIGTPIANRQRREIEPLIGFFVNTLVLRGQVPVGASFTDLIAREKKTALDAFAHQDTPFEMIVDSLGVDRAAGRSPLFQVWFVHQDLSALPLALGDLQIEPYSAHRFDTAKFDLSVYSAQRGRRVELGFVYDEALFDSDTIERMAGRLVAMLTWAADEPDRPVDDARLCDDVRAVVPDPRRPLAQPTFAPVHREVEALAAADPAAIAIRRGDRDWTRDQLWRAVVAISRALAGAGVAGERVALVVPGPSFGMVAGLLGIMRSGACVVPLSSSLPEGARRQLIADAGVSLVVDAGGGAVADVPVAELDPVTGRLSGASVAGSDADPVEPAPDSPAYVYFTSGTTGAHKGVVGVHGALGHFLAWQRSTFGDVAGSCCAQLTHIGFDVFLRDVLFPLTSGKLLALPDTPVGEMDIASLMRWIDRSRISALHAVPSLASAWVDGCPDDVSLGNLRCVFFAGEPLSSTLVERWRRRCGRDLEVVNLYGPTETTLAKCYYRVPAEPRPGIQPIGHPLPQTQVLVMRSARHVCEADEPGELVIRTPFRSLGYVDRNTPENQRFVVNPHTGDPADLLYRTGDRGVLRDNGVLEILGRVDDQLKIRGQRVDPAGIASLLLAHPGVRDAAVVAHTSHRGEPELAAYVVTHPGASAGELRRHLRDRLPAYMVPSSLTLLDALPVTARGKLDRGALPAPVRAADSCVDKALAPRCPEEDAVAAIWAEVLAVERVGPRDDFFALGGHSLLATQVVSRVREVFDVELPLRALFDTPTVEGVAAEVMRRRDAGQRTLAPPLAPADTPARTLLSHAQQRMWLLDQVNQDRTAYRMVYAYSVRGGLDVEALRRAFEQLVGRHESLRTVFAATDGVPRQEVRPAAAWSLPVDDLRGLDDRDRADEIARISGEHAAPFDLASGPLLRTRLIRLADDDHILVIALHHIVSDGWSRQVFLAELDALYSGLCRGRPVSLPPLPVQYADYGAWQRRLLASGVLAPQLAYWRNQLAGAPADAALPLERPRPPVQTFRGARVSVELDQALADSLRELGRTCGATLFMILLAGFRALLSRVCGQDDLCIGTPVANRQRREIEGAIGFFVNTLVLRTPVGAGAPFSELLAHEKRTALDAFAHQDAPFELVVETLGVDRSTSRSPLFQVWFVHHNTPARPPRLGTLAVVREPAAEPPPTAKFDLSVHTAERGRAIRVDFVFNRDLFAAATIEKMAIDYEAVLAAVTKDPQVAVRDLPLTEIAIARPRSPARILPPIADSDTVWSRFERTAAIAPDRAAIRDGERVWTYAEVTERARAIAGALAERSGRRVALMFGHGGEVVTAMLGVAASGSAYVPIDPGNPPQRLLDIVDDCAADVVLTDAAHRDLARDLFPGRQVIATSDVDGSARASLPPGASEAVAYILYTSGSTGRAKGVVQSHRNVLRHIDCYVRNLAITRRDRLTLLSTYGFDAAVIDIYGALLAGATLCPYPVRERGVDALAEWLARTGATIYHSTPTVYRAVVQAMAGRSPLAGVRAVVLGGERVVVDDLRSHRRHFLPPSQLISVYGSTEYSISLQHVCDAEPADGRTALPLGCAVDPDIEVSLETAQGRQLAIHGVGEINVRSRHVSLGYWNRPDSQATAFVPGGGGTAVYRTGDLARLLPGGALELVGRRDRQVKLHGLRIELDEIEIALAQHPSIARCVVAVRGEPDRASRLVAYVVPAQARIDTGELRAHLRGRLPDAMIPSAFVPLDALPTTSTGKIDATALPDPAAAEATPDPGEPRSTEEELVAAIWAGALGRAHIGIDDNFFALGGQSLLAVTVIDRVRNALGRHLDLQTLFDNPTVRSLVIAIGQAAPDEAARLAADVALHRGSHGGRCSPIQERWYRIRAAHAASAGSPPFRGTHDFVFTGEVDVDAMVAAFAAVVRRQSSLRTAFRSEGDRVLQTVLDPDSDATAKLEVHDLRRSTDRDRELELAVSDLYERPLDISAGSVVRAGLLQVEDDRHQLVITADHLVRDGRSATLITRELFAIYSALRVDARVRPDDVLGPLDHHYADWADHQWRLLASPYRSALRGFWAERLADAPDLELPHDRALTGELGPRVTERAALPTDLLCAVDALVRPEQTTRPIVLLAALFGSLHRRTGQTDLCVVVPTDARGTEFAHVVGHFALPLLIRVQLDPGTTFRQLCRQVRARMLEAHNWRRVPLYSVCAPRRGLRRVAFNYQRPARPESARGLRIRPTARPGDQPAHADMDLQMHVIDSGGDSHLALLAHADAFLPETRRQLIADYLQLAADCLAAPDRPLRSM